MPDVSIKVSVIDHFSDAITTMRQANQSFNKDLTATMEKLNALNSNKIILKADTDKAKEALKAAEKQFTATGSAADKLKLKIASANYDNTQRNLNLVSKNAMQTEKNILSMADAASKAENRAGRVSSGSNASSISGILSFLDESGLAQMLGDSLSGAAQTYIGSAFDQETGNMVNGVLGGTISGAAMGSTVLPGLGTAVGAVVGGVSGAISAATQNYKNKDEAFQSVMQDTFNNIKNEESSNLESGIEIAKDREHDLVAFSSLLNSDTEAADDFQKSLIEISRAPSFSYDTVSAFSKEMLGLGDNADEVLIKMNNLAKAANLRGWSSSQVDAIFSTLVTAAEDGGISSQVLETLEKSGLNGVEEAIAEAFGIRVEEVSDKVSKMDPESVINALYNYMGNDSDNGTSKTLADTYEGQLAKKQSYDNDIQGRIGQEYTKTRQTGLEKHNAMMSGNIGDSLKEAYAMQGKFKAQLENKQEELLDNAYASVVSGAITGNFSEEHKKELLKLADDYWQAMRKADAGDSEAEGQATQIIEKAKIIAQNEYKDSHEYKLELQDDRDLAEAIGKDTVLKDEYWDAGYIMGQQFSQGRLHYLQENREEGLTPDDSFVSWILGGPVTDSHGIVTWRKPLGNGLISELAKSVAASKETAQRNSELDLNNVQLTLSNSENTNRSLLDQYTNPEAQQTLRYFTSQPNVPGKSTGLFRVPYNNYLTLLHEGEAVSTAVEARSQKSGGVQVTITGPVTVRKESDIDDIASEFYKKLIRANAVTP